MSDFLHNLRSGKMKRSDKYRRSYGNHQNTGYERRKTKDYKNESYKKARDPEVLNEIKQIITGIAESQQRIADAQERKAKLEEHKTEILENLFEFLKHLVRPESTVTDDKSANLTQKLAPEVNSQKPDKKKTLELIHNLREDGMSYEKIANFLDTKKIPTFSGRGKWRGQTINRLCNKVPA